VYRRIWRAILDLLTVNPLKLFFRGLFIVVIALPALMMMLINISHYTGDSTQTVLKEKETQSLLAATIVTEKLNGYFDLTRSFATRPLLIRNVEKADWEAALHVLDGLLDHYPNIVRIVLYDTHAVIKADMPPAGVVSQSRADKEWYREYSKVQGPYLSGVYQRTAKPRYFVVSINMPVYPLRSEKDALEKDIRPIAILQTQLNLDFFHNFTHTDVGIPGLIYIFDQHGHIVYHPNYPNSDKIIDFSSVEIVQKTLSGKSGAELNFNPVDRETRVAGYRTIPKYGWGVVVTQAVKDAFAARDEMVRSLYIVYISITGLAVLLGLAILYIFISQKESEEKLKDLALLDELTGLHNRRGFLLLSQQQMKEADRMRQSLFLAYVDINKLKLINDRFGHEEGDRAIIDTATIIRQVFRDVDIKARIGGDEFVALGMITDSFNIETIQNRFQSYSAENIGESNRPYTLSLSTGITLYDPSEPCRIEDLMVRGDQAMYEIKSRL